MSKIIAVTSGKGGVGKSTVSAGIGQAFSRRGKTAVILELDMGLRGMDLMLGIENDVVYDFGDLIIKNCTLDAAAVPVEDFPNLYFLAAPATMPETFSWNMLLPMLETLKSTFDLVILDMPAGVKASLELIPGTADLAVIVATPDYVSVRDSNKMATILAENGFTDCKLIINKVNVRYRKMNMITDLDFVLDGVGVPLLGVLPEDLQIKDAFSNGLKLEPETAPMIIFDKIVSRLEGEYTPLYIE